MHESLVQMGQNLFSQLEQQGIGEGSVLWETHPLVKVIDAEASAGPPVLVGLALG